MPQPPLPKAKREAVIRLWKERKGSNQEIADAVGVSVGSVSNILRSQERDELIVDVQPTKRDLANKVIDDNAKWHKEKFEHGLERLRKWIGDTGKVKPPLVTAGGRRETSSSASQRINSIVSLVANDLHAPFMNEEAFGRAIREAKAAGATQAIIPGDLADFHAVSRYPKTRKSFSLVEEFQGVRAALRILAEEFETVHLMRGNHDERWFKWLVSQGIPPDVLDFLKLEYEHSLDPIAKLAADFPNVRMMETPRLGNAHYAHIAQMGDVVFSHSEKFSIIAGKATADVNLYCQKKYIPMGVLKPYKVLLQAHTHSAARFYGDFGVLCIENGCLAQVPDYDSNPKLMGREPILGYTLLVQENGVTDQNKTHFYRVQ